ncbi:hypothetical protein [Colwellia sp. 20A7]|uniref:hypothetical protein n=1 Tax=Colwellia sp. 20A7 TaxID=2689569 RepID=UPI001357DF2E|nr:hypothetical protein [Colwellia sp. 20A7]
MTEAKKEDSLKNKKVKKKAKYGNSKRATFAYSRRKSKYIAKAIKFLVRARSCGVEYVDKEENPKLRRKAKLSPQEFEIAMYLLHIFLAKAQPFHTGLVYNKMLSFSHKFATYSNYLNKDELGHSSVPEDKVMKNALNKLRDIGLISFKKELSKAKNKEGILVTYIKFKNPPKNVSD